MPVPRPALAFHALRTWCELINSCGVQDNVCVCVCVCVCVFLPEQSSRLGSQGGVGMAESSSKGCQAPPLPLTEDPSRPLCWVGLPTGTEQLNRRLSWPWFLSVT